MIRFQQVDFKPKQSLETWFTNQPLDLYPNNHWKHGWVSRMFEYHIHKCQKIKVYV